MVFASVLAMVAAAAIAPSAPASAVQPVDDPIVVEGRKGEKLKQALRTVTDMTMIVESQIARFHSPICPMVIGMERSPASRVEARIRTVAAQAGAYVDKLRCDPNLLLFVAGDGARLFNDLRHRRPNYFDNVSAPERRWIASERPARAWHAINVRKDNPGPYVWQMSNFRNATFYNIDGASVIIDAGAIEGLTLRQVADYAAMRGLAKIRPPENVAQLDSILSLFERPKGEAPRELTEFDRRYLREMYEHLRKKGYESSVHERYRLAKAIVEEK